MACANRPVEWEHGVFTDDRDRFSVRSATSDPGTVRVHAVGTPADSYFVVVLTEVGTPNVDAAWCGPWADRSSAWKAAFLGWTFHLYFNRRPSPVPNPRRSTLRDRLDLEEPG